MGDRAHCSLDGGTNHSDIATASSLSTLPSMFDDEERWGEFKSEFVARNLTTGLGTRSMMSNFVADKSRQEQREQERERGQEAGSESAAPQERSSDRHHDHALDGPFPRRDCGGRTSDTPARLYRRLSSSLTMPSFTTGVGDPAASAADAQQHQFDELWALPARWGGDDCGNDDDTQEMSSNTDGISGDDSHQVMSNASNDNRHQEDRSSDKREERRLSRNGNDSHRVMFNPNDNHNTRETEKLGSEKEERGLSRSCPPDIYDVALPEGRPKRGAYFNDLYQRLSSSYTSGMKSVSKEEGPNNLPFNDWFGSLGREFQGVVGDQNKPSANWNDRGDGVMAVDSGPSISQATNHPLGFKDDFRVDGTPQYVNLSSQPTPHSRPSCVKASNNCDVNQGIVVPQAVNGLGNAAVSPSQQPSHPKPSCLKMLSPDATTSKGAVATDVDDINHEKGLDDSDESTFQLLSLLLSHDCGPSEERAKDENKQGQCEEKEKKGNGSNMQQGTPSLGRSSGSSSADFLFSKNKRQRYKPRRKHGSRVDEASDAKELCTSGISSKEVRQRQVLALQGSIVRRSLTTEGTNGSSDSSDSDSALERQMQSMMSTGSMMDMRKRHIPVMNSESKNRHWSSIDWSSKKELQKNENTDDSVKDGNAVNEVTGKSGGDGGSDYALKGHMHGLMSTGSMLDMKKRHIPVSNAENGIQDWSSTDWSSNKELLTNGASAPSLGLQRLSQMTMPAGQPSIDNGNAVAMRSSQATVPGIPSNVGTEAMARSYSILSMMSTGSSKDMRRRHVPTMTSAERQNQDGDSAGGSISAVDWGTAAGEDNCVALQSQPQLPQLHQPDDNAYMNRQRVANVQDTVGSTEDEISRPCTVPKAAADKGSLLKWQQQQEQQPVDQVSLNLRATLHLQRIHNLKERHSERQLSVQASDDSSNGENSTAGDNNTPLIKSVDFIRRQVPEPSFMDKMEEETKKIKVARLHPLSVAESKEKNRAPSPFTQYLQKRNWVESKNAWDGAHDGSDLEEIPEEEPKNVNNSVVGNGICTDLFRRYFTEKERWCASQKSLAKTKKGVKSSSPTHLRCSADKTSLESAVPRHSVVNMSTAITAGRLLVEWGDTAITSEDEDEHNDNHNLVMLKNEVIQEPYIGKKKKKKKKKKERQEETIVWAGGSEMEVEERCITVDLDDMALRRVSDITTFSFDSGDDCLGMMDGYPREVDAEEMVQEGEEPTVSPALAFRRKMRSLSIAEEPSEEEDYDDC